jgi:hypothetical protein
MPCASLATGTPERAGTYKNANLLVKLIIMAAGFLVTVAGLVLTGVVAPIAVEAGKDYLLNGITADVTFKNAKLKATQVSSKALEFVITDIAPITKSFNGVIFGIAGGNLTRDAFGNNVILEDDIYWKGSVNFSAVPNLGPLNECPATYFNEKSDVLTIVSNIQHIVDPHDGTGGNQGKLISIPHVISAIAIADAQGECGKSFPFIHKSTEYTENHIDSNGIHRGIGYSSYTSSVSYDGDPVRDDYEIMDGTYKLTVEHHSVPGPLPSVPGPLPISIVPMTFAYSRKLRALSHRFMNHGRAVDEK